MNDMALRSKRFRSLLLFACVLALSYYCAASLCIPLTDGFSIARIHSDLPYNPAWETAPLTEQQQKELDGALKNTFHYLGCGGQCFAFASEDGRYVIKFFKHRIRKPYSYLLKASLPWPLSGWCERKLNKALFKLHRDFTSYKIAYEELQEETALLYIHLNKGTSLHRSVCLVDKLGIKHTLPLDDVEFIVQARAELAHPYIEKIAAKKDEASAREAFQGILHIIVSRCKKGIFDEDPRIHRNLGFANNKPLLIDVGRFVRDPKRCEPSVYKADLLAITKRFRTHLQESHPELVPILDEELYRNWEVPRRRPEFEPGDADRTNFRITSGTHALEISH
jgi:hypothetical protein